MAGGGGVGSHTAMYVNKFHVGKPHDLKLGFRSFSWEHNATQATVFLNSKLIDKSLTVQIKETPFKKQFKILTINHHCSVP